MTEKNSFSKALNKTTEAIVICAFVCVEITLLVVEGFMKLLLVVNYPIKRGVKRYNEYKTRKAMKQYEV